MLAIGFGRSVTPDSVEFLLKLNDVSVGVFDAEVANSPEPIFGVVL